MSKCKVYEIDIPEYNVKSRPDWESIGSKIDVLIKDICLNEEVLIRCLGSQDHPGKSVTELVNIILDLGHDRYDSNRTGDRYDNIEGKHIDIFALDFIVKEDSKIMENLIEPFWTWPPEFGREPIRLDIVVIYKSSELEVVEHQYEGREGEIKRDAFVFKDSKNKSNALRAIIKIN